ncbi:MAG: PTS sugar transporter subunit IIA [Planctomycetota bacterium]|nr:PTS sugar transporter subunit IIA [Planctomycetota bacterium]
MKLCEFLNKKCVVENLKANEKKSVIKELTDLIRTASPVDDLKVVEAVEAVMAREKVGSTGIGGGVAVPHAKLPGLTRVYGAFCKARQPIEFGSIDGEPVDLIFLLLSPAGDPAAGQEALKAVAAAVKRANFCKFLRHASGPKEILDLFREADESFPGA